MSIGANGQADQSAERERLEQALTDFRASLEPSPELIRFRDLAKLSIDGDEAIGSLEDAAKCALESSAHCGDDLVAAAADYLGEFGPAYAMICEEAKAPSDSVRDEIVEILQEVIL